MSDTRIQKKPISVSMRLNQLESFLSKTIILGDDLKELVLKGREHNKKILKQNKIGSSDIIYRNFLLTFDQDTGRTVKLSLLEQKAENCMRNLDLKNSLTKKDFISEVT